MRETIISDYDREYSTGAARFTTISSSDRKENETLNAINYFSQNERPKYSIFEVANWFLSRESMTHKKLQKLCYYAQAWCYAINGYRLTDAVFEAWIHGPVSPVLYDRFKGFGWDKIRMVGKCVFRFDKEDEELLESVWETYGDHTGNALEALSHSELPWKEARKGLDPDEHCRTPISVEDMKQYYSSIYIGDTE